MAAVAQCPAARGLTAPNRSRRLRSDTTGGPGMMHEGFDPSAPETFTRPWNSLANSMFAALLLEHCVTGGPSRGRPIFS